MKTETLNKASADEFQYLESVIKNIPEVNMSVPYVEIDENIAQVIFKGPLADGVAYFNSTSFRGLLFLTKAMLI
jgi:hypothetical protein